MTRQRNPSRAIVLGAITALATAGCAFQGVNSLPLPGAVGRGSDAAVYHVELANVGTLESNSPVMIDDVVVGSVGELTVDGWHANVEISVKPGVAIPANAVATVGQTSVLGSMHLALDPPAGQPPAGRLPTGGTIPLASSSTYPSAEQTLASLAAVVNGGGLGQLGDIIHSFNAALSGREEGIRDLITRLDQFLITLNQQRDHIVSSIRALDRLAGTLAAGSDTIANALNVIPPALDVLVKEQPRITAALEKLRAFSDTTTGLVDDTQADLVRNLTNLAPTLRSLADVGPDLDMAVAYATTFPLNQNFIDRAVRGDYVNLYTVFDLTVPRLKRTLLLGTRFGEEGLPLVPAPGDPAYLNYTYDPLGVGVAPPSELPAPPPGPPMPSVDSAPTPSAASPGEAGG